MSVLVANIGFTYSASKDRDFQKLAMIQMLAMIQRLVLLLLRKNIGNG